MILQGLNMMGVNFLKMIEEIYASYQHYDKLGRRLSIYGWEESGTMIIYVFTCSKKDRFNKSHCRILATYLKDRGIADFKYLFPEYHPQQYFCKGTRKSDFIRWCNNNYYKIQYYYASIPGIPLEIDMKGKYCGTLLKRKGGVIIKYLGK
jgi:hypothetical protein